MSLRGLDLPVSFAEQYRSIEWPPWGGVIDQEWNRILQVWDDIFLFELYEIEYVHSQQYLYFSQRMHCI